MAHVRRFLSAVLISSCTSCGETTSDGTSSGGASGSETGGSNGSASAGSATGGQSGGDTGGGAGTGGAGGRASRCNPPPPYTCEGGYTKFVHDPATGSCKRLSAHECNGGWDGYEFATLAECLEECGARPAPDVCDRPSDCTLIETECCGCEPVEAADLRSVNAAWRAAQVLPCANVLCDACVPVDELSTTRQYFVPTCSLGTCSMIDIRQDPATECAIDADCSLRDSSECCDHCDGRGLVAVSSTALFAAQCTPDMQCPSCDARVLDYAASCSAGRCQVVAAQWPAP